MNALGSADWDFVHGIVKQLLPVSRRERDDSIDEHKLNFLLSMVEGIEPKDQLETMLAAQMVVVHFARMMMGARFVRSDSILEQDSTERIFNKLARTFAMQLEALKRYRSGVEQKVTLQHVSVAEGGQTIVGDVTQAPRTEGGQGCGTTAACP
jgi:hypothetical protein